MLRLIRRKSTVPRYYNFINGKDYHDQQFINVYDPSQGSLLAQVGRATQDTMTTAIENGHAAFETGVWSRMEASDRFRIMVKIAEKLEANVQDMAVLESLQTGRPIKEMKVQLGRVPEWIEYFASVARNFEGSCTPFKGDMLNVVQRVPLGVVGQITPWNHPVLIAIKKIAPALAAGNSVLSTHVGCGETLGIGSH